MTGLGVSIYRDGTDATNNGVTSPKNADHRAILFGFQIQGGNYDPRTTLAEPRVPRLVVQSKNVYGTPYVYAVPCDALGIALEGHWMAGGNYVGTCDSRFRQGVCQYPIPVHDRKESWCQ